MTSLVSPFQRADLSLTSGNTKDSSRAPVAVIILDTLRADMVDQRDLLASLPTIRRLFSESYVFTRAYAPSHWTLPSHASVFTGLAPSETMAYPPSMKLRGDVPTIAEIFSKEGYFTACITCNPYLSDIFGMTRGFEITRRIYRPISGGLGLAVDLLSRRSSENGMLLRAVTRVARVIGAILLSSPRADNGARAAVRLVGKLLQKEKRSPFLVVNLLEAHHPYYGRGPYSKWRSRVENAYILTRFGELRNAIMGGRRTMSEAMRSTLEGAYWENAKYLDTQLDGLLRNLPKDVLDSGYVIILSDHGQLLGEKGLLGHVAGLSERLIRVPLAVRPPGGTAGESVSIPVDITSLFTLLRSIATNEPGALASWLDEVARSDTIVSEAHGNHVPYVLKLERYDRTSRRDLLGFKADHDYPALACIAGNWKLICHLGRRDDELYDLKTDSSEEVNLVTRKEDVLNELHEKLRDRYLKETPTPLGRGLSDHLSLDAKRVIAETVLKNALEPDRRPVVLWTGGKDSTLVLHLATEVARQSQRDAPPLLFIDHGQHFPETWSFMDDIATEANLKIIVAQNEDLLAAAKDGVEAVPLDVLNPENQAEALKAGLTDTSVLCSLETAVGNHLLKTVALKRAIRNVGFDTVITGIRWDESPARSGEVFFSRREDPPHMRVHPILPWTEREVWAYTLESGLPIHPLYKQGYRSFDGIRDSEPIDTRPAWEQDLEETKERAGRAQDKEKIMERLRALGYF